MYVEGTEQALWSEEWSIELCTKVKTHSKIMYDLFC